MYRLQKPIGSMSPKGSAAPCGSRRHGAICIKTWGDEPYRALSAALKICNVVALKIALKNQKLKRSSFRKVL
jgi:hypothetical protein